MSSKIFVRIYAVLREIENKTIGKKKLPMCPTAHVPYCPCALLPMCPIAPCAPSPRSPICICSSNQGTIYPCAPLPMCPIAHVPHCSCVKKMSSCQKDVKLSKRCQMSKSQTHRLWRRFTKKINWHNEVHTYWRQFWCQIWRSPKLFKNTFYAHFEGFWWPSYMMSKLTSKWVNLIMSIYFFLWTSSIVYVFDFLTFDIFLTIWHILTTWHLFDRWAMWHMGNGAHGQWGTFIWHIQT